MSKLPDFEAWAVFAKVAETGSFSTTAQVLNLSQPTVSKIISRLESRLKTSLLQRTSRKLSLTESGLRAQAYAKKLLADGEQMEAELLDDNAQLQGKIRFALPISFGISQIAPLLPEFCAIHPKVELDMHLSDAQTDLISGRFDFAVRIARLNDSSFRVRKICTIAMYLVAAPAYIEHYGILQHPKDLEKHRTLVYSNTPNTPMWKLRHIHTGEYTPVTQPTIQADNASVFLPTLLAGQGIALLLSFLVKNALTQGSLKRLLMDWEVEPLALYLLSPPISHRTKRVQALMDFLVKKLRDADWSE